MVVNSDSELKHNPNKTNKQNNKTSYIQMKYEKRIMEAAKKVLFLMAVPLRGGRGVKRLPLRKKLLFGAFFKNLLKNADCH